MGTIALVLQILGVATTALPIIEKIFGGLMTYAASIASQLFGADAAQKLDDIKTEADGIVAAVEKDIPGAETLVQGLASDLPALFALFPGLAPQLAAEYNVMKGQNIPRSLATTVVKAAHSDLKIAKP